ncbi:unnamed protein product [Closterium sp. NIES-54]
MVGDDEESDYEECAFTFFSPVEMLGEPATLKEALESIDAEEWKKAMESELKSIEGNGTWELVELPEGRKAITSKWLFKIKSNADGKIERYKSRFLGKGYQQKEKVDYKELFAPVVKPTTLRTLLAGATIKGWVVKQIDVTTVFLNGILEEEIFFAKPDGFDDGSGRVLKLKKALYALKQAPRQWYLNVRGVLEEIGFTPSTANHSLFMLGEGEQRSFMVVYVDDILIFSPSSDLVKEVMLKLQDKFKCKALGDVNFYLELHIERDVEKRCMRLVLGGRSSVVLTGHSDASWADDQATQRSSLGYTFSLGSGSVSWRSTRSSSVLDSSCEVEIYAGAMAALELRWLTYLLTDLEERPHSPPVLYVNNKAMLALCREQRMEHRTKHIALRFFHARELQRHGQLRLSYVASRANTADVFTKALGSGDHQHLCIALGLVPTLPHLLVA